MISKNGPNNYVSTYYIHRCQCASLQSPKTDKGDPQIIVVISKWILEIIYIKVPIYILFEIENKSKIKLIIIIICQKHLGIISMCPTKYALLCQHLCPWCNPIPWFQTFVQPFIWLLKIKRERLRYDCWVVFHVLF